jgi:hypothetical protein
VAQQDPNDELVMGAAIGLTMRQVAPFLTSLRNSGYAGRVVLFLDAELERALRHDPIASGVTLVKARQWLPFKLSLLGHERVMRLGWSPIQTLLWMSLRWLERLPLDAERRLRLRLSVARVACTPMESRFLRYRRFLAAHPHRRVLLTDVRDVLFQNDPFLNLPQSGLAVSMESTSYTVATEPHNAAWVERAYGPRMLEQIGANTVSCVGVTYGDAEAIANYLEQMTNEILRLSPAQVGIGGADTAIHNVLLWTDRLGSVRRLQTLASPIATLNGVDERDVRLTAGGRVLNADGSEASVVHQYDRLPTVSPKLLRALAG